MNSPEGSYLFFPDNAVLLQALNRDARFGKSLLFQNPAAIVCADAAAGVLNALHEAEAWLARGYHLAGYVAYEAGYAFEERFAGYRHLPVNGPLVWFGVYRHPEPVDIFGANPPDCRWRAHAVHHPFASYAEAIRRIRDYIAAGDVYQINYTYRALLNAVKDPFALFSSLCRMQRAEYAAFIRHGGRSMLSLSPELFFHVAEGVITTRPMKGTARRGNTSSEDGALFAALHACPKNRAENTMIVDLLRNDLGRICKTGSVRVESMFDIERYETVHQMTSTVTGLLQKDVSLAGIFRNLFPCGSVTGAPKIRAMEIIHELEDAPRGVYAGAIGYAAPGGGMLFNVAIRTIVAEDERSVLGLGSGIVWDSIAEEEYRECLMKAGFLEITEAASSAFQLIETLRYENGFRLIDLHLDRLAASADYFGFIFSREKVRAGLDTFIEQLDASAPQRVRLLLARDGSVTIEATQLEDPLFLPARVSISDKRVDSDDVFLYHKTTRRDFYTTELRQAQEQGLFDILFQNERGEITEGCIANVLIEKNGMLLTPPVNSGLLAGVYRRHVLETHPNAHENILTIADLHSADALFLCNAVRGMMPAVLL